MTDAQERNEFIAKLVERYKPELRNDMAGKLVDNVKEQDVYSFGAFEDILESAYKPGVDMIEYLQRSPFKFSIGIAAAIGLRYQDQGDNFCFTCAITNEKAIFSPSRPSCRFVHITFHIHKLKDVIGTPLVTTTTSAAASGPYVSFMQRLYEVATNGNLQSGSIISFGSTWWDNRETSATQLYVRNCYDSFFNEVERRRKAGPGFFVMTGTPGTGKSAFGLYAVMRFVIAKVLVVYAHKNHPWVLFIGKEEDVIRLNTEWGETFQLGANVLREESSGKALAMKNLVRVIDPTDASQLSADGQVFDLIVTSPDDEKLSVVDKSIKSKKYYMELWSVEEIRIIAQLHAVTEDQAEELFNIFGGVPRHIFKDDGIEALEKALSVASNDDLGGYFTNLQKGGLSAYLVHRKPVEEKFGRAEVVLASEYVKRELLEIYLKQNQGQLQAFVAAAKQINALATFRGKILEREWHERIMKGGMLEMKSLGSDKHRLEFPYPVLQVRLPSSKAKHFDEIPTGIWTNGNQDGLRMSEYALPNSATFESVDSFKLVSNFDGKTPKTLWLVVFQMAAAKQHAIKNKGLLALQTKFPGLPIAIVFVSESDAIQNILQNNNKVHKDETKGEGCSFPQYLLVLKSKLLPNEETGSTQGEEEEEEKDSVEEEDMQEDEEKKPNDNKKKRGNKTRADTESKKVKKSKKTR